MDNMPSKTKSNMFFYAHALGNLKDRNHYIGYTKDLRRGLEEHKNQENAKQRECCLKIAPGRKFLTQRLKKYKFSYSI